MKRNLFAVVVLLILMVGIAACDRSNEAKLSPTVIPTITVLPPFLTETPRVTATLTPSNTPTPSDTPPPSETPTPVSPTPTNTLTPTPPIIGRNISSQTLNVREGDSFQDPVLANLPPGSEVEAHYINETGDWVFVRFIDEEGKLEEGWVIASALDTGELIVPTLGPTATPTSEDNATLSAFVTATPDGSTTPEAASTPGDRLSDVNVLAYCRQARVAAPTVRDGQTVSIWWSWYVARPELMQDHLAHAKYEVLLDGRLLANYDDFETLIRREGDGRWYVYWYVPVGELAAGRHEVTYRLTWDAAINDGYEDFGPDTATESNEGDCVFTVSE